MTKFTLNQTTIQSSKKEKNNGRSSSVDFSSILISALIAEEDTYSIWERTVFYCCDWLEYTSHFVRSVAFKFGVFCSGRGEFNIICYLRVSRIGLPCHGSLIKRRRTHSAKIIPTNRNSIDECKQGGFEYILTEKKYIPAYVCCRDVYFFDWRCLVEYFHLCIMWYRETSSE